MRKSFIGAVCACLAVVSFSANAAVISGQGTWETALQGRDFDGDTNTIEGYYDTVLDITWLADANLAANNTFGVVGIAADGGMTPGTANSWLGAMNSIDYLGYSAWRLPINDPINGTYFNTTDGFGRIGNYSFDGTTDLAYNISAPGTAFAGSTASEMTYLYYNILGNLGFCSINSSMSCITQPGYGLTNTGPFSNIQEHVYLYETVFSPDPYGDWDFWFSGGEQSYGANPEYNGFHAWAVHDGDVGASIVPIPSAIWLFGSGLIGLIGVARRKA